MDELLTDNVAALAAAGAISLQRVAQDGMRVRADAGAASFRRQASLQEHLSQAGELAQTIKKQAQTDPGLAQRKAQAAQLRAAQEREERIRAALAQLPEVAATKKRNGGAGARTPERAPPTRDARVMKMGDGGFRPAFNVQFATTCDSQVIVGMDVVNAGSDMAQLAPMVKQVEQRLGHSPDEWLLDGGFPAHEQIDAVADKTEVYAPVPEPRASKEVKKGEQAHPVQQDKHQPKPDDSPAVAQWRQRMASSEAAEIYKQRAATAECVNAQARNRGLLRMAGARLGQAAMRGGSIRAGAQPDAHGRAGAAAHRLGDRSVRNGRERRMRGQEMTKRGENAATKGAAAPFTRTDAELPPGHDQRASWIDSDGAPCAKRKTLDL